ncbi:unnamed protein product (macronuclear) [Paramecium tetraurelia]|uniref:Uncharacterized protein n=2 Tax=Paramecium TaxID=5884 RepID=A0BW92_PARTE|nr:uncharacterized protein GSPATT00032661001 [Paramecium tetraurelia]CAD8212560.1 unnamed protein product [Paramecium octaurelia]CAK62809.1 unnamed protein product [Paramecium tetraurelia]|eukprot:XP_001430207.1 hypothetical protein (macronuclear) [Paramecium tetraurelia strain d4-2]
MQSPQFQKSNENSTKSDQFTQGWLPITNDVEQSIVSYLDQLGINQLIQVEKHSNQRNSLYSLDQAITPPKSQRRISLTMDSELFSRRSFRMCSEQI